MTHPKIVCLCGSSRFKEEFEDANRRETLAGNIVLSIGMFGHCEGLDMDGPVKKMLDELHLRKIDLANEVLFLNPNVIICGRCHEPTKLFTELSGETECCRSKEWDERPYIGESTGRELSYAYTQRKKIRFLNDETGKAV